MSAAPRYNRWQYDRIAPYLGTRICEIGSGIGNMSRLLAQGPLERLLLTDVDPYYLDRLRSTFAGDARVGVEQLELPDLGARDRFAHLELDTVVALNVFEHIHDDLAALESTRNLIVPGGRVVILVPALPLLHGSLDRALGHWRRYSRAGLSKLFDAAGFELQTLFYFNLIGMAGWLVNSRVLQADRIPLSQLRVFDAAVPVLRLEDRLPRPLGQSLIAVGTPR